MGASQSHQLDNYNDNKSMNNSSDSDDSYDDDSDNENTQKINVPPTIKNASTDSFYNFIENMDSELALTSAECAAEINNKYSAYNLVYKNIRNYMISMIATIENDPADVFNRLELLASLNKSITAMNKTFDDMEREESENEQRRIDIIKLKQELIAKDEELQVQLAIHDVEKKSKEYDDNVQLFERTEKLYGRTDESTDIKTIDNESIIKPKTDSFDQDTDTDTDTDTKSDVSQLKV